MSGCGLSSKHSQKVSPSSQPSSAPLSIKRSKTQPLRSVIGRKFTGAAEFIVIPALALAASFALFGVFVALFGKDPLDLYFYMYQGAFGTWFSWQNSLTRAAPLILTALCTAAEGKTPVHVGAGNVGCR